MSALPCADGIHVQGCSHLPKEPCSHINACCKFYATLMATKCANEHADAARLSAWILDTRRKPAVTAFTEGPERQIAYAIETMLDWHP